MSELSMDLNSVALVSCGVSSSSGLLNSVVGERCGCCMSLLLFGLPFGMNMDFERGCAAAVLFPACVRDGDMALRGGDDGK